MKKNKNWEVSVVRTYLVEAPNVEEARAKGLACNIGQIGDFEFGGMKILTQEYAGELKINGHRGEHSNPGAAQELIDRLKEPDQFDVKGSVATYRRTHAVASEKGLIQWAQCNGYSDDEVDLMVDQFLDEEWDWKSFPKSKKTTPKQGMGPMTTLRRAGNGDTAERTDRNTGKEHEYLNFGKADGV